VSPSWSPPWGDLPDQVFSAHHSWTACAEVEAALLHDPHRSHQRASGASSCPAASSCGQLEDLTRRGVRASVKTLGFIRLGSDTQAYEPRSSSVNYLTCCHCPRRRFDASESDRQAAGFSRTEIRCMNESILISIPCLKSHQTCTKYILRSYNPVGFECRKMGLILAPNDSAIAVIS